MHAVKVGGGVSLGVLFYHVFLHLSHYHHVLDFIVLYHVRKLHIFKLHEINKNIFGRLFLTKYEQAYLIEFQILTTLHSTIFLFYVIK